ncbi:Exonuclease SbcC [Plantibacter sp. T3]|nr:Exonuclease SbcC [Plantibacter sp. T3]
MTSSSTWQQHTERLPHDRLIHPLRPDVLAAPAADAPPPRFRRRDRDPAPRAGHGDHRRGHRHLAHDRHTVPRG